MAEYAHIMETHNDTSGVKDFFDQLNTMDNIPISLGHW